MKFSVIIPVYNVEKYLDICIKSILNQRYRSFEVILVDDGSTDKSGEICDTFAQQDARIKVIHKENGGLSSARNAGIDVAEGEYILYLDSDDYWLDVTVLEEIASRLSRSKADVLILNLRKDFGGELTGPYFSKSMVVPLEASADETDAYIFENELWTACAWNKVTKRSLYEQKALRFREGITAEDIDWTYRLAMSAARIDFLNIDAVGYRQRKNSITGTVTTSKVECLLENIKYCVELAEEAVEPRKSYLMTYLSYQYGTLLHGCALLERSAEKSALKKEILEFQQLLEYSRNRKILVIRRCKKIFGLDLTLMLLAVRARIEARFYKRRS